MALRLSPQTSPYFLTNLGRKRPGGKFPVMSTCTKTWPEQPLPAPMPIVGTDSFSVTSAATSAGTASTTIANAPASCTASASSRSLRAPLDVLPWTLKPPKEFWRCGVNPTWPRTGMPADVIFRMVGAISLPPSSLTPCTRPSLTKRMAVSKACSGAIS
ncbi:hypothetical protein CI238_04102 [Colletotrichum incanum]|uniref:Uncharacterized protein n=1 Tax=Colletotrichum incanum TaxID=1573173 RepID=A0A167EDH7_COLIC|nr:hypothetical protein CI238_04102 [Colletotrichum incanum]